ncbi:AAA family ATPase, partial [Nostoc sp. NIES-2111]
MPLKIVTAEERLSEANLKTSCAIFGPPGVGKTHLLKTLPADKTVCFDLEAGLKSVQDWQGASIPVRDFESFRKLAVLVGGPDPAAHPESYYGQAY